MLAGAGAAMNCETGPTLSPMVSDATSASSLLARAEEAWAGGDGEAAMAFFGRAADLAEADGDLDTRVAAVLGLARGHRRIREEAGSKRCRLQSV